MTNMNEAFFERASLADLPAFGVAHETNAKAGTGCTVVVMPQGAVCGADVRGGGPATRETDLLRPENMIQKVHSVVLSGGSAFGLAASTGVMDALAEKRIGFQLGSACVPIVVEACLFDLLVGENVFPGHDEGYAAATAALAAWEAKATGGTLAQGNVGAGCGATVGKLLGPQAAMKGGFGWAGLKVKDLVVAALVAVNACGNVCDRTGRWIAGCHDGAGNVMDPREAVCRAFAAASAAEDAPCTNTTLGVVLTNARLTKAETTKAASMAHDAYARAIEPVHTMNDGDTIFVAASGEVEARMDAVGMMACEAMRDAIVNAVTFAEPAYGLPASR